MVADWLTDREGGAYTQAMMENRQDWQATHMIGDIPVRQDFVPAVTADGRGPGRIPQFIAQDGRRVHPSRRHKAIRIPRADQIAPPVEDRAGLTNGPELAPGHSMRTFQMKHVAPAFAACLGAHEGVYWVFGPDSEAEYVGPRGEDGSYWVVLRIKDGKLEHRYVLRIPE